MYKGGEKVHFFVPFVNIFCFFFLCYCYCFFFKFVIYMCLYNGSITIDCSVHPIKGYISSNALANEPL